MSLLLAAAVTVGLNVYSWHSPTNNPDVYSYQSFTPGLYVRAGETWNVEAGVYRNSQGYVSPHVGGGYTWQATPGLDLSVGAGVVYGYRDWEYQGTGIRMGGPELRPYIIPSVGVRVAKDWVARAYVIPALEKDNVWCLSFAIERRF